MARAGLTPERIVAEAGLLADEAGMAGLSFATLAQRLGVKVPSLYKHVASLDAVRQALSVLSKRELADAVGAAAIGHSRREALEALAHAYREWAGTHPGRYETTLRAADPSNDDDVRASTRLIEVVFAALGGYGLSESARIDATRMLRASLHGYVALEAGGGFMLPLDVDRSFDAMIAAHDRALVNWP